MKKIISLILALILAISLVACTDKKDDPDEGTLDDFSNIFKDGFELPKVPITWG